MSAPNSNCPKCSGSGVVPATGIYDGDPRICECLKRATRKAKAKLPKARSQGEEAFLIAWRLLGGPEPERPPSGEAWRPSEYKFHRERAWRFDFAWTTRPELGSSVAVEIEGGTKGKSRHTLHHGFVGDCEKYNEATRMGWRVFRLTPDMIDEAHLLPILELMR